MSRLRKFGLFLFGLVLSLVPVSAQADWTFTVTSTAGAVVAPHGGAVSIFIRENSATPTATFTIWVGSSITNILNTGTVVAPGQSYYIVPSFGGPASSGQVVAYIKSSGAGPYTFVAVESSALASGFTPGGDLGGTSQTQTVLGLRGIAINSSAPSNGQVYEFVAANNDWEPVSISVPSLPLASTSGGTGANTSAGASGRYLKSNGATPAVYSPSTLAAAGTGSPTSCTNQVVTGFTLNADAVPTSTCTSLTQSFLPPATSYMSMGYTSAGSALGADTLDIAGIVIPPGGLSVGHIIFHLGAGDGTNNSDVCIFNGSGSLVLNIGGATYGTGDFTKAVAQGTATIPGGRAYVGFLSHGTTFNPFVNLNVYSFFSFQGVAGGSGRNGVCPASISVPADSPGVSSVLAFTLAP